MRCEIEIPCEVCHNTPRRHVATAASPYMSLHDDRAIRMRLACTGCGARHFIWWLGERHIVSLTLRSDP